MGYNTYETLDNTLRGEPYGSLTPQGQSLWDQYTALLNAQKNVPMRNLNLRSGASMQIPDPGTSIKNRMLSGTLRGMTGTNLGTRAAAQPGLFSQLAPLLIAAGIKNPEEIKKWLSVLSGGSGDAPVGTGALDSPPSGTDWDVGGWGSAGTDFTSGFSPDDLAATGGDWGWLD